MARVDNVECLESILKPITYYFFINSKRLFNSSATSGFHKQVANAFCTFTACSVYAFHGWPVIRGNFMSLIGSPFQGENCHHRKNKSKECLPYHLKRNWVAQKRVIWNLGQRQSENTDANDYQHK